MKQKPVTCAGCKHYYITWDKDLPYGCHIYGFKSHQLPSIMIKTETGSECIGYAPRGTSASSSTFEKSD